MREKKTDEQKALDILLRGDVFKIKGKEDHFIVKGNTGDHLVLSPNFCSCDHFIFRCIKTKNSICYHIRAVMLANKLPEIEYKNIDNLFIPKIEDDLEL